MINLFKTPRPDNICETAHRLTKLKSLVALPQLEENLYFPLVCKSQQHQTSNLLPIAVSTIISGRIKWLIICAGGINFLTEERRTCYCERHNSNLTPTQDFKVGDIIKAHVQDQPNSDSGTVYKLSYQVRGPLKVIEDLGHNSFHVQRLDENNGAIHKYKGTEFYLLSSALFTLDPLDTPG